MERMEALGAPNGHSGVACSSSRTPVAFLSAKLKINYSDSYTRVW